MDKKILNSFFGNGPLTKEDMEFELATSRIKNSDDKEFSEDAIKGLLKELNLGDEDDGRKQQSS